MAKPLTLYSRNANRVECGMHTFTGPIHVVLVMDWPEDVEPEILMSKEAAETIDLVPQYFQVHCPQYQQPMIFEATKKNLKSYWKWQADE